MILLKNNNKIKTQKTKVTIHIKTITTNKNIIINIINKAIALNSVHLAEINETKFYFKKMSFQKI